MSSAALVQNTNDPPQTLSTIISRSSQLHTEDVHNRSSNRRARCDSLTLYAFENYDNATVC